MPLRLEQGKKLLGFQELPPTHGTEGYRPPREVYLLHERRSKRRVAQERVSQRCSSQKEEACHLTV